jgi:glutathione S-transferase
MSNHELVLYQYTMCRHCYKVRRYMDAHEIQLPLKDTLRDPEARAELIRIGGKGQVPALMIDGRILYESNAIIAWLHEHFVQPQAAHQG